MRNYAKFENHFEDLTLEPFIYEFNEEEDIEGHKFIHVRDGVFKADPVFSVTRKEIKKLRCEYRDVVFFGFYTEDELSVFKLLISISGIGPKGALAILSTLSIDELRIAVLSDDHKAIAKANGVGAKTAQRVVIELKDKFKLEDVLSDSSSKDDLQDVVSNDIITETAMALTSLGYSNVEALRAIKKVPSSDTMSVEELLKAALKYIM